MSLSQLQLIMAGARLAQNVEYLFGQYARRAAELNPEILFYHF